MSRCSELVDVVQGGPHFSISEKNFTQQKKDRRPSGDLEEGEHGEAVHELSKASRFITCHEIGRRLDDCSLRSK